MDIKEIEKRYTIGENLNYTNENPQAYNFHFMVCEIRALLSKITELEEELSRIKADPNRGALWVGTERRMK